MGKVPTPESLNLSGLNLTPDQVKAILEVNASDWIQDLSDQRAFFDKVGDRLPKELRDEQARFAQRLNLA
jgi:phosphoenolpyruvate carboxykinase (GTP)